MALGFGFPASYKRVLDQSNVNEIKNKLDNPLLMHPFIIENVGEDKVVLKMKWSVWSWGENITIDISDKKAITIISKCICPVQLYDWGKNKENVELLISKLQ